MSFGRFFIPALLLALSLLGGQVTAWAHEFGIARPPSLGSQQQSYFERPDILQVEPREHPELDWTAWRQAHLEAAAAFLELYPTQHLYFLARDAELLYDAVRLISRDDPQTLARLHLLNVSRANMRDAHLLEYLAQEGITPERLRSDPSFQPIFIDTGFSGTIPSVIAERMPQDVRDRLKTHLLVSSNAKMPSLRSFLYPVNPAINGSSPSSMHGTIIGYEHIARTTDRSDAYQLLDGEWHPVSNSGASSDGQVDAVKARQYQEDLRAHLESPDSLSTLQSRRGLWRKLRQQWLTLSQEQWVEYLKSTLANASAQRAQIEPVIRDFLEWANLIGHSLVPNTPLILPTQIGLTTENGAQLSNKAQLIAQYPEWAAILENPDTQIPALLDSGQVSTLGAILDVTQDNEIRKLALKAIATRLSQPPVHALAEALLEKLGHPAGEWTLGLFTHPASVSHPELLRLVIEKTPSDQMYFADRVLSQPHWTNHPELLRLAIEKTPSELTWRFAMFVFSQHHWTNHPELLRLAIEKTPSEQMHHFAENVFREAHWVNHPELLRLAIEKATSEQMITFAIRVFSQTYWANHPELLRLVIEKATSGQMWHFAYNVFIQPNWSDHPNLLRLALEKAPSEQMSDFASYVFSQHHWANHPQFSVFQAAAQIADIEQRRAYFREQLGPYSWETAEQPSFCEQQMLEDAS